MKVIAMAPAHEPPPLCAPNGDIQGALSFLYLGPTILAPGGVLPLEENIRCRSFFHKMHIPPARTAPQRRRRQIRRWTYASWLHGT
jgi:hypothetical protein